MSSSKIALVIQACYEQLVEGGIYSPGLVTRMYSLRHITAEDMEQVNRSDLTSFDRSRRLLDILRNKSDSVLDSLLACLHEDGTQPHLETAIFDAAVKLGYYQAKGGKHKHETGGSPGPSWPGSTETSVLPEKWWPHHKALIRSFVKRTGVDGQFLVHQLRDQLCNDEESESMVANKVVIVGMGGIGKTSMAKWYANEYDKYYYHIIWLDSEGSSLESSFNKLGQYLHLLPDPNRSLDQLVSQIYEKYKGTHCLFIFDNAERFDGRNGLKDLLPREESHHALITSRNLDWGNPNEFGQIATFPLDVFTGPECVTLLSSQLGPLDKCNDQGEILELGNVLGFLPLALQCAVATIIKSRRYNLGSYLARIKEDLKILLDKKILNEYERSISATLHLSILQIEDDEEIDEECREFCKLILNVAAYCEPSDIPENLFYGPPNARPSLVADACDQLVIYSLLSPEKQVGNKADHLFRMHRLFQHVIRQRLVQDKQSACQVVQLVLDCMEADLDKFYAHAMHAWSTVSACLELDQIQLSCHQFPYNLSLRRHTVSEMDFLRSAIGNMKRVYQTYGLPLVQLKLRLIELLCKLPSDHAEAKQMYGELLKDVGAGAQVPFRIQLLLHLRIFATELLWKFHFQLDGTVRSIKEKQRHILQSYQEVLRVMNKIGYDGRAGELVLHFVQYKQETGYNVMSLRLRVVLNCAHHLHCCGKTGQAIELINSYISPENVNVDVNTIWSIVNFLVDEQDWELLHAIFPTINGNFETNLSHPHFPHPQKLLLNNCRRVLLNVDTIKKYCKDILQRTQDCQDKLHESEMAIPQIVEIVQFLALTLRLSTGKMQWLVDILLNITHIVGTVLEPQNKESRAIWANIPAARSVVDALGSLWSYWVALVEQTTQTPPQSSHEQCFSALLALNTAYSNVLVAAGEEIRILDLDAQAKHFLSSDTVQWKYLHAELFDHYLCYQTITGVISGFFGGAVEYDAKRKKLILESKLDLALYIIESSTRAGTFVHTWLTDSFCSLMDTYDTACYIQFNLDGWNQAENLWHKSRELIRGFRKPDIELIARTGRHTLAWLESRQGERAENTLRRFMTEISELVLVLVERQERMHWISDPEGILQLIIRLVRQRLHQVAEEIITSLQLSADFMPCKYYHQVSFGSLKELLPSISKLSKENYSDRQKDVEIILGKLNQIQLMYSKAKEARERLRVN